MILLIILFAILIFMAGVVLVIRPSLVFDFLGSNSDKGWVYASAIVVRALLGWILIQQAVNSKFPQIVEIFGWLMLAAALFLLLLGRARFTRLVRWLTGKLGHLSRVAGVFGMIFGALLVYVFV